MEQILTGIVLLAGVAFLPVGVKLVIDLEGTLTRHSKKAKSLTEK